MYKAKRPARVACGGFLKRQELLLEPSEMLHRHLCVSCGPLQWPKGDDNPELGREVACTGGGGLALSSAPSQNTLLSIGPLGQLEQSLDVAVAPTVLSTQVFGLGTHSGGH